jgi:ribosomal protein S18 acetylase RimI-like enzyme
MPMLIRPARISDAEGIARVHVESWRTAYPGILPEDYLAGLSYKQRSSVWESILSESDEIKPNYVAVDDNRVVVGFAGGGPKRSGDADLDGELYVLHLLKDSQRHGVGRKLVTSVASDLARNGMVSMFVWVLEQNRPACLFYEALGGLPVREQKISIGGVTLNETGYGWPDIGPLTGPTG